MANVPKANWSVDILTIGGCEVVSSGYTQTMNKFSKLVLYIYAPVLLDLFGSEEKLSP